MGNYFFRNPFLRNIAEPAEPKILCDENFLFPSQFFHYCSVVLHYYHYLCYKVKYITIVLALIRTSLSGLIRLELMSPGTSVLTNHHYNTVVTRHRIVIVFFFIIPFLIRRFRNWLIPLFVTTPDMSFPRINNFSFWIIMPASIFLVQSMKSRGTRSRWTIYPPLSTSENCIDIVIFSLHCARVSSILRSANFIVTIILNSPKRTQIYNAALFLWCMLVTSFMLLTTLPVLARAITIILFDRHFRTSF